jgi:6,7-dimethyl-8-ribityllumazine synthase
MSEPILDPARVAALQIGVVAARFNSAVTDRLLEGALTAFRAAGVPEAQVHVVRVPGAFEIPLAAASFLHDRQVDGVVCLGAIVRGETQHHHYLGTCVFDAIQRLAVGSRRPVALGVLTTDNMSQALARAGADPGNKGYESAQSVLEMVACLREISGD